MQRGEASDDRVRPLMADQFLNRRETRPSAGDVVRRIKDGYWDRTDVIELADGSQRVRKRTKGAAAPGPWGVRSLRREIRYLTTLPDVARVVFPTVLAAWDDESDGVPDVGYEMPFYLHHVDASELARHGALAQPKIDEFQDALASALFDRVHEPIAADDEPLSAHVVAAVENALAGLEADPVLAPLIQAETVSLNGKQVAGPRAAFAQITNDADALQLLDANPCVRLHGDFFLENILWRPDAVAKGDDVHQLLLVDPVSVAGVVCGPPVFDLVKYESYATGELLALRSEWVDVAGFESADVYRYRINGEDPALQSFRTFDWHSRFRSAFEVRYGPVDRRLYRLIDGYFSVAMALNTGGLQRRARLLKATAEFNAVL